MPIVTLTTDFGYVDGYVAAMKGVILSMAPSVTVVDISHGIAPQAVAQAAYVLRQATPYFPPGTIHVCVVDPGVGGARRALAVRTRQATFVAPDNGVLTAAVDDLGLVEIVHLNRPEFWLPKLSRTFHGRDLFAPVAAHLAQGVPLNQMGERIKDPMRLQSDAPRRFPDGSLQGQIIHRDHFGNLITNIPAAWLPGTAWQVGAGAVHIVGISSSFSAVKPGELLAYCGSAGTLEIAVRNGDAAARLALDTGAPIAVVPTDREANGG